MDIGSYNKKFGILLIEDNDGDIELIQEALGESKADIQFNSVTDGKQALQYLRKESEYSKAVRPDLILLDLNLPKVDGRALISEIKSDRYLKPIPIIVFSTSDSEFDIFRSYMLGANCYITKASSFEQFARSINSIVDFWITVARLPGRELVNYYREIEETLSLKPIETGAPLSKTSVRVLLVEDDPGDAGLLQEMLSEERLASFHVETVCRLQHALKRMENDNIDVVLLDLGLPDSQGYETFKELQKFCKGVAIIIVTGFYQRDFAMQAVRSGAQDYLFKGEIDASLLSRVIRYAIERNKADEERTQMMLREHEALENAEKALLTRNELLAIAMHELKTPLTTLKMLMGVALRTIKQETDPARVAKSLKEMLESSQYQIDRLAMNINELMDLSVIKGDMLPLNFEQMDLSKTVKDVVNGLRKQLELAECSLTLEANLPVIGTWDKFRIEQVVINLLTNAIKYGAGKPIEVIVASNLNEALLSVRDYGIGIAKVDQERIFQRFERTGTAKRHGTGLGLGLYIIREIVDLHGGYIRVKSAPGKGASFTVILPQKAVKVETSKNAA